LLLGQNINTNPSTATPTPSSMRDTGAITAAQTGTMTYTQTTNTSNLTYTQTNTASPIGTVVLPAGAFITNIYADVTAAFNASTNNTLTVAISATNGTAGMVIFQVVGTGVNIPVGRWDLDAVGTTLAVWSGSGADTNIPYWTNVSYLQTTPTNQIVQAYFTGTGTAASTGAASITIVYILRNADGSWYLQTPAYPIANPATVTY
jgi:hypothetical protein